MEEPLTKDNDEFDVYEEDKSRVIIFRDYATSIIITKFDENAYPTQIEQRKVKF